MNDGQGDSQNEASWKVLYQAALLELDRDLLAKKIVDAERAIHERALVLLSANGDADSETEELEGAALVLNDLKKIQV